MIHSKNLRNIYPFSLSLILALVLLPLNATELTGTPEELKRFLHPNKNIIRLNATAKLTAYEDKAIVQLTITTEKPLLSKALAANGNLRTSIKQALTKSGVKTDNIHTSRFSSSPQFGWFGKSPKSYQVVNRMSISIYNEDQLTEIAKLSDANKAIEISSTQFEHTKKNDFLQRVKQKALAKIMKQKVFYQKQLNIKLKTYRFAESQVDYEGSFGARERVEKIRVLGSRVKRSQMGLTNAPAIQQKQAQSFDEIEYRATLYVEFILDTL